MDRTEEMPRLISRECSFEQKVSSCGQAVAKLDSETVINPISSFFVQSCCFCFAFPAAHLLIERPAHIVMPDDVGYHLAPNHIVTAGPRRT